MPTKSKVFYFDPLTQDPGLVLVIEPRVLVNIPGIIIIQLA